MRIVAALFAQNAEASQDGLVDISGGFLDTIEVGDIPVDLQLRILVRVEFQPDEVRTPHFISLRIVNPDGTERPRIPNPTQIDVNQNRANTQYPSYANHFIQLGLYVDTAGTHTIKFFVDEQELEHLLLHLNRRQ